MACYQGDLFAGRTPTATMQSISSGYLCLSFFRLVYVPMYAMHCFGHADIRLE